ncbi:MAG: polynucleotide adenylyltransferase PcnB [Thermoanaerobaculales bacterium]
MTMQHKAIDSVGFPTTEILEPRVLSRPEHRLSRRDLSPEAIKVLYRLHRSGYQAFLVGGSVRDILLGRRPKDFDVATNARPQEIRRLFRNSRIIGRRFRLVHVFFRGEIIEVATFRASPEPPESPDDWEEAVEEAAEEAAEEEVADAPPLRHEEDVYGTPAEDARRRDFTVNAIFYNIADFSIIDHVGGINDLEARVIRTIGDPDQRFEEDPVRMMRALEYAVRLDFEVEERTTNAIDRQHALIAEASAPRLTYELLESLRSGVAAGIFKVWEKAGLFADAFPDLPNERQRTWRILDTVDSEVASGQHFTDASLLGGLYLPRFFELVKACSAANGRVSNDELLAELRDLMAPAGASMHLSNQTLHLMQQGLFTLTKMRQAPERGRQVVKLARQEYFRVAWDLHGFAVALGLVSKEARSGWKKALDRVGKEARPEQPVNAAEHQERRPRRRPRRRRRR